VNINEKGEICMHELKEGWSSAFTVGQILELLLKLLAQPNADEPLNPEIGNKYKTDKPAYEKIASEWTKKYAM